MSLKIIEDLNVQEDLIRKQNAAWNSTKPLFSPDGDEPENVEIGAIPKRTTG